MCLLANILFYFFSLGAYEKKIGYSLLISGTCFTNSCCQFLFNLGLAKKKQPSNPDTSLQALLIKLVDMWVTFLQIFCFHFIWMKYSVFFTVSVLKLEQNYSYELAFCLGHCKTKICPGTSYMWHWIHYIIFPSQLLSLQYSIK